MTITPKGALDTMTVQLAVKKPELARSPHRLRAKAKGSIIAVVLGCISVVLVAGGCWVAYLFAKSAIKQSQPVSVTLLASLLIPLVPGTVLAYVTAARFDSEAGSVFEQLTNTVKSFLPGKS